MYIHMLVRGSVLTPLDQSFIIRLTLVKHDSLNFPQFF